MWISEWKSLKRNALLLKTQSRKLTISEHLVNTLILAEDRRFNRHFGVDPRSLARALLRLILNRKIEGGSTIAMQLVRVLTGNYQRTVWRKLKEIVYVISITRLFGRNEIPSMYLSVAYFGWKMNGLKEASIKLNFNPSNACEEKSFELIARLKSPEGRSASEAQLEKIKIRKDHIKNLYSEQIKKQRKFSWCHLKSLTRFQPSKATIRKQNY